ncbi:MAG: ABC transporter permease [Acidimicrobiia bacterium]|nr:ABC transporter permease [Acidimicrobiia bacterium]
MRTALFKLIRLLFVVLVVTFLSFSMLKLQETTSGSDVVDKIAPFGSPEAKATLRAELHLKDPFFVQYGRWLGDFATGDFGKKYTGTGNNATTGTPVSEIIKKELPVSIELMIYAQVLALLIALPLGIYTAYKNGSIFDRLTNMTMFAMLAMPAFLAALLLQIWAANNPNLGIPTQYIGVGDFPLSPFSSDNWTQMLFPMISLAVAQIAVYMRLLRSDMIATLQEDFITTAKAKGIPARRVLLRHAFRPSSLTLLTVAGLNVGALIGGAIVVEQIFNLPGIGNELVRSILGTQAVETQAIIAIIAVIYVLVNFLVDILYTVLDPRIRHARAIA